ncbi:unnamed protein product, partial [Closterium sp. NIES-54]
MHLSIYLSLPTPLTHHFSSAAALHPHGGDSVAGGAGMVRGPSLSHTHTVTVSPFPPLYPTPLLPCIYPSHPCSQMEVTRLREELARSEALRFDLHRQFQAPDMSPTSSRHPSAANRGPDGFSLERMDESEADSWMRDQQG